MQDKDFMALSKEDIARLLKEERAVSGLSPSEVSGLLKARGFDISESTIYGYENCVSTPKVPLFLALCDIYGITDIMAALGFTIKKEQPAIDDDGGTYGKYSERFSLFKSLSPEAQSQVLSYMQYLADKEAGDK